MKVKLNGELIEVSDKMTLSELLQKQLNIDSQKKGIAVAINDNVIPKNEWHETILYDNDEILVIIASQGG